MIKILSRLSKGWLLTLIIVLSCFSWVLNTFDEGLILYIVSIITSLIAIVLIVELVSRHMNTDVQD